MISLSLVLPYIKNLKRNYIRVKYFNLDTDAYVLKFIKNVFMSLIGVVFISLFKISPLPNYFSDFFKIILNYPCFEDSSLILIILTIILSLVEAIKYVFSEKLVISLEMRIDDLLNPAPSDQGSRTNLGNSISGSAENTQNNPISVPSSPTPTDNTDSDSSYDSEGIFRRFPKKGDNFYFFFT